MEELVELQRQARQHKAGIWSLPPPPAEAFYIRSSNAFIFHRPDCKFAAGIPEKNAERIPSRDDALDRGLSPCRTCRP